VASRRSTVSSAPSGRISQCRRGPGCRTAGRKLKPGRLIAGDDWDPGKWPGVVRAVEEFVSTRGLRVQVEDKLWSLEKPQEDAPASS